MTFASVCSGIGGFDLAFERAGMECLCMCEIDRQCREVLKCKMQSGEWGVKDIPIYEDMCNLPADLPRPDVLCGGTPCQSFSVAGLRAGLADPRGNLALVFLSLVDRLRPDWVLWENVPGVHSSWSDDPAGASPASGEVGGVVEEIRRLGKSLDIDGCAEIGAGDFEEVDQSNDFDCFLSGLEQLGYGVGTTILDAQYFGVAQRRERVFVVGHIAGRWQRAAAVLFDGESVRGNSPPRREKGERVAGTFGARATAGGGLGTDFDLGGGGDGGKAEC